MTDPATETMIANLPDRTGKSLAEWLDVLAPLGLERHGDILACLKGEYGMSHGYANLVSILYRESLTGKLEEADLVGAQYQGAKAALRPIYDAIVDIVRGLGADVEIAPKKGSVSLRRSKQFALVTPATRTRIDLGLNLKGESPIGRLEAAGGMCTHKIAITRVDDVDDEVVRYLRMAYERA